MKMADYLHDCGIEPVFIDNASTYQPLLDYYKNCKYETVLLNQNFGHTVIWDAEILFMSAIGLISWVLEGGASIQLQTQYRKDREEKK